MPSHERLAASVHRFAGPAAWISIIVGVAVLLGWIFDIQVLKSVVPGLVSMKANTALGFVFSGVALWLLREDDGPRASRVAAGGLGAVISVVAALTLAEYVFGIGLGIDHLFRDAGGHSSYPGRPSPHTATAFLAVGLWIVVLARQLDGVDRVRDWLSAIACLVVLQAAIGSSMASSSSTASTASLGWRCTRWSRSAFSVWDFSLLDPATGSWACSVALARAGTSRAA
jgi:hypothetical protein